MKHIGIRQGRFWSCILHVLNLLVQVREANAAGTNDASVTIALPEPAVLRETLLATFPLFPNWWLLEKVPA